MRAHHFARNLAISGDIVTVLTISPALRAHHRREWSGGVEVVETPDLFWGIGRTGWDPWDTAYRMSLVARGGYDIVHAFDCRPAVIFPALAAARASSCPLVIDWADWWGRGGTIDERGYPIARFLVGRIETFFEEGFRTRANATTVISNALAARAAGLGVPVDTIARIPQGCDTEGVHPIAKAVARAQMGLPNDSIVVGHLGVLLERDAALLLEAVQLLSDRYPVTLLLIGRHKARLGLKVPASSLIIETGFVADAELSPWLAACDVLALPLVDSIANRGRWPSKGNAYLAAARPIVVSAVGDYAEFVKSADAGLVTAADPQSLSAGLEQALSSRTEWSTWGANGRTLAEGHLSWPTLTAKLIETYRSVA